MSDREPPPPGTEGEQVEDMGSALRVLQDRMNRWEDAHRLERRTPSQEVAQMQRELDSEREQNAVLKRQLEAAEKDRDAQRQRTATAEEALHAERNARTQERTAMGQAMGGMQSQIEEAMRALQGAAAPRAGAVTMDISEQQGSGATTASQETALAKLHNEAVRHVHPRLTSDYTAEQGADWIDSLTLHRPQCTRASVWRLPNR